MWDIIVIAAGVLAVLGLWAMMAGNFIDSIRRTKKADNTKDKEPDQ